MSCDELRLFGISVEKTDLGYARVRLDVDADPAPGHVVIDEVGSRHVDDRFGFRVKAAEAVWRQPAEDAGPVLEVGPTDPPVGETVVAQGPCDRNLRFASLVRLFVRVLHPESVLLDVISLEAERLEPQEAVQKLKNDSGYGQ